MAAVINGTAGSVTFSGGTTVAGAAFAYKWTLSYTGAALDSTVYGATAKTFILGITEWDATVTLRCDDTNVIPTPGAVTTMTLTSAASQTHAGACVITNIAVDHEFDGQPTYIVSVKGNGALTLA